MKLLHTNKESKIFIELIFENVNCSYYQSIGLQNEKTIPLLYPKALFRENLLWKNLSLKKPKKSKTNSDEGNTTQKTEAELI